MATKIQGVYRGHVVRAAVDIIAQETLNHPPKDYAAVHARRVQEKNNLLLKVEMTRTTELLWAEESEIAQSTYSKISERITLQKTEQAFRVLSGIRHGTIVGFSFLDVSKDLGVPHKALCRWLEGQLRLLRRTINNFHCALEGLVSLRLASHAQTPP